MLYKNPAIIIIFKIILYLYLNKLPLITISMDVNPNKGTDIKNKGLSMIISTTFLYPYQYNTSIPKNIIIHIINKTSLFFIKTFNQFYFTTNINNKKAIIVIYCYEKINFFAIIQ